MVQNRIDNNKIGLNLLRIAYAIFLTYSLIGHIDVFKTPLKYSTFVAIAILIINFFIQYNNAAPSKLFGYLGLMVIALIHSYYSDNYGFFKLMLFAGSMSKIDFKRVIKFDMYLRIVLISVVYFLCSIGIAPDVSHTYNGITRRSLGFTNPNTLGIAVFVLVCDILYVADFKLNLKLTVILSAISVWLFSVARSRTAVYGIFALMIVSLFYRYFPQIFKSRFFKTTLYITPPILAWLTFWVVNSYIADERFGIEMNNLLSGRVKSIARFVHLLSPKFWGQPIHETLDKTLDNTYAFVLYDLGILVFIIFFAFYMRTIKENLEHKNIALCIIMFAFMFYGLSEHLWINVDYNIFMLAFCYFPNEDPSLIANTNNDIQNLNPKNIYMPEHYNRN